MSIDFDLDWVANFNLSQRKNDFLVVDGDPDSDAPAVPRDVLLRDPGSDGISFRATLNDQLVLENGVSLVTINARGGTTKAEVLSVSGGPTIITPQPRSTGLLTGGEIVAGGVSASEFTVETGTGVRWDGTTDPTTPTLTTVTWPEFTDQTTIGTETFVYITLAGALNLSASRTPTLDRSHILLGLVIDSGTSLTIINAPITANQMGSYLSDLYAEIAIMINDVVISPNANLTVQNSAGTAFGQSINWHADRTAPNEIAISANNPMPMTYVTQDGDFAASTVTNMDVGNYNPTGGTISAIGGGVRNSTNQRIYITPFGFATLYGQTIFSSLASAVDGADTENPVIPEWLFNYGTLLVTVSVIRTATDLSDDIQAIFNYSAEGGSGNIGKVSTVHDADLVDPILSINAAGDITILPVVDSLTALQVQQADTSIVLDVDTINARVGIGTAAPNFQAEITGHVRITEDNRLKLDGTGSADVSMDVWGSTVSAGATNYLELQTPFVDGRTVLRMVPKGTPASVPTALEFYGTDFHADGTNWERLSIRSGSTYQIFTENNGTGALRPFQLTTGANIGLNIDTAGKIGIGTTAIPHGANGIAMLALDGANASTAGPHIQTTTATDDHPALQVLTWSHDNIALGFDMYFNGTNFLSGDATSNFQLYKVADQLRMYYAGPHAQGAVVSRAIGFALTATGNVGFNGNTAQFGSGAGVIGIANAGTNPSANPTGGGVLYSDAGAGKWRGSGGTTTTFGPADPHCPDCGRDFVLEWENEKLGHLVVCMWCLTRDLEKGVVTRAAS